MGDPTGTPPKNETESLLDLHCMGRTQRGTGLNKYQGFRRRKNYCWRGPRSRRPRPTTSVPVEFQNKMEGAH